MRQSPHPLQRVGSCRTPVDEVAPCPQGCSFVATRDSRALRIPLSVAPMMDRTDRHLRYFLRLLTRRTLLYTEMITTGAILFGDRPRHLDKSPEESPVSLQLGGDDPRALAECAKIAEDWGY